MAVVREARGRSSYARAAWRHFDGMMLIAIVLLSALSILMIHSATLGAPPGSDLANAARRQAQFALLGLGVYFGVASIDYRLWSNLYRALYAVSFALLAIALILGSSEIGDVRRWIDVALFNIQPAELAKVLLIPALAGHLAAQKERIGKMKTFAGTLALIAAPVALIFAQPNLSTAIVVCVVGMTMFYVAGMKARHALLLAAVVLIALPLVWSQMADYQRARIATFLDPRNNPDAEYNLLQAEISIGNGGLFGQGYAQGSQSQGRFLKVRHTDFIFSVIGEELGFAGAVILLALIGLLLVRLLRAASLARDDFGRITAVGVFAMLLFQSAINIAMNLRLVPVAGLPLPLVSYGGSSLVTTLIALGIVQSIVMRHKKIEF
ncbi:MAG TPA: FtsW/RodA/SpoVE family cell cycle protein [Anaerolineae bacterium]|nr:FtsW/RodA/SpoVE family cell cycle protein [Anaerolineae bacterium]